MGAAEIDLQYGIQTLQNEDFVDALGLEDDAEITVHAPLDGGKKKKHKKKKYETPKKIKHKHLKRPKAAGAYMAEHPDRYTCGKTGTMFYKLTESGERLPIPKQKKIVKEVVVKKVETKKKKGKKGG